MDLLLDNPIASMDGAAFLLLFIVFIVITVAVLAVAKATIDSTDRMPIPAIPPQVDPFEISYLRGGANELARSVVFSLVQKGFVQMANDGKDGRLRRIDSGAEPNSLSEIEQLALRWVGSERDAKDVFDTTSGLIATMESRSARYELELSRRQFLMPEEWKGRMKKYGLAAALAIAGVGGFKMVAAIMTGRFNILFAIFLTIVGFVIARGIGKLPRVTKLGNQYLARLQSAFEGLKYQTPQMLNPQAGSVGVDPLLLSVGVFGTGILAGTAFSNYNDTFARQHQAGTSCGSACGSGCGSSGGSGDGGGGSCGGGCGGCS
ncbi:MAG: TIGR04222 domain-containing membrane protein [bacterium]|nr:TIGR04222 domain-containing membrane protein [bacterium]